MPSMQCCEAHRCAPAHMPQAGPLVGHKKFLSREGAAFCRGRNGREPENTRWPCLHLQVVKTLAMQHAWSLWLEVAGSVLTCGSQRAAPGPLASGIAHGHAVRPLEQKGAAGAELLVPEIVDGQLSAFAGCSQHEEDSMQPRGLGSPQPIPQVDRQQSRR